MSNHGGDDDESNLKPIIVSLSSILNGSHKVDFQLESPPANPVSDWILSANRPTWGGGRIDLSNFRANTIGASSIHPDNAVRAGIRRACVREVAGDGKISL